MGLAGELDEGGQSPLGRGVIRIIWVAGERQQCDAAGHLFHFVVGEVSVGVVQGVNALSGQVGEGVVLDGNLGVTAAVDGVVTANAPAEAAEGAAVDEDISGDGVVKGRKPRRHPAVVHDIQLDGFLFVPLAVIFRVQISLKAAVYHRTSFHPAQLQVMPIYAAGDSDSSQEYVPAVAEPEDGKPILLRTGIETLQRHFPHSAGEHQVGVGLISGKGTSHRRVPQQSGTGAVALAQGHALHGQPCVLVDGKGLSAAVKLIHPRRQSQTEQGVFVAFPLLYGEPFDQSQRRFQHLIVGSACSSPLL